MKLSDIRSSFLDFFATNDHEIVPSSSLVPHNDPTLLFTNAGMVQFKDVFTGLEKRDYKRATSVQRCVRAGGKHNDLENVGYTARHHTFFEMLGNFSFGDYFKEEAITYAWEFITKTLGVNPEKLLVTVYHEDEQAFNIWKKLTGWSDHKIIKITTNDNFWAMGDTGPCGPCTEIFYDHGEHIAGGPPGTPDEDGDRFVEIWNLVFMQFEQKSDGTRISLPKPSIDTGMGLERVAALMQGVHSNYETDLFVNLVDAISQVTGQKPTNESLNSYYVIADHLRASGFMIGDGILPSNEGRGYVLRRIMRRAMRHVHMIYPGNTVMWQLVEPLIIQMGQAHPELKRAQALITNTLQIEEERFQETLDRGLKLLTTQTDDMKGAKEFPGKVAFTLYDTYGFPLDLTQDILRGRDITVNTDEFNQCMDQQKEQSRKAWSGSGEQASEQIWYELYQKYGATEFLGYMYDHCQASLLAIVKDGQLVDEIQGLDGQSEPIEVQLVFNQTPFYGNSGGQEGDHGYIANFGECFIHDTTKPVNGLIVHHCILTEGKLKVGENYEVVIDRMRRNVLEIHHSATHLLHGALRQVLGESVTQKGSLVAEDKFRFDFSHNGPVSKEDLDTVEALVNELIIANTPVNTQVMDIDSAMESGAMALFGEKYDKNVRVLSMGDATCAHGDRDGYFSVELCGGTHVSHTGDIGSFYITSESGVAAGVRRIEAVAGECAYHYMYDQRDNMNQLAKLLKTKPDLLYEKLEKVLKNNKELEKSLKQAQNNSNNNNEQSKVVNIDNIKVELAIIKEIEPQNMKSIVDNKKQALQSGIVILLGSNNDKSSVVVGVTDDLSTKYSAVEIVRDLTPIMGGKGGGGRPDMAQGGGKTIIELAELEKQIGCLSKLPFCPTTSLK